MRFMMIMFPKEYVNAKPGWAPDLKSMEAMGKYNQELGKAGAGGPAFRQTNQLSWAPGQRLRLNHSRH